MDKQPHISLLAGKEESVQQIFDSLVTRVSPRNLESSSVFRRSIVASQIQRGRQAIVFTVRNGVCCIVALRMIESVELGG